MQNVAIETILEYNPNKEISTTLVRYLEVQRGVSVHEYVGEGLQQKSLGRSLHSLIIANRPRRQSVSMKRSCWEKVPMGRFSSNIKRWGELLSLSG